MPRIVSSGDDIVVGQTVPSTTVDPSSGIGATPSASSSDVDKTIDAGKLAVITKPACKFGIKGFTLIELLRKFFRTCMCRIYFESSSL